MNVKWYPDIKWYQNGVLIVTVYFPSFPTPTNKHVVKCKKFLKYILPKALKSYVKEIDLLVYSFTKNETVHNKMTGCQYTYSIKNVTPEFFKALFDLLEVKKSANSFLNNYTVIWGDFVTKSEAFGNE